MKTTEQTLQAYFATRLPGQKTPAGIVVLLKEYLKQEHAKSTELKTIAKTLGTNKNILFKYASGLKLNFLSIRYKNSAQERKEDKKVKTIKEIVQEDTSENRYFSTMIMGANPEALERISYRTEKINYEYAAI